MKPFAAAALASFCLAPVAAFAQATNGFHTYCQVEDTGKRDIWVSQVFATPPGTDLLATALATEFHRHVATLGGAGNKICVTAVSRAAAEQTRAKIAAIMGKRSFGIRVYDWHDVNWTPSAATYANAPPPPVAAANFVYCRFVDTDKHVLVASDIFVQTMPPKNDGAHYQELSRYGSEFGARAAAAEGVDPQGALCIASDTRAEADKSRNDYRKAFPFSGIKKVDLAFAPGPAPAAKAAAPAAAATIPAPAATQPVASRSSGPTDDVEEDFWGRVSASRHARDFEDYLAAYPQGRHAPVARLEIRRLGGAIAPAATAPAGIAPDHPGSVVTAAPAPAAPAYPISEDVAKLIAGSWFFRDVPAGLGATVARSGTRNVRVAKTTVPVTMDSTMQRESGSDRCRIEQTTLAGQGGTFKTTTTGQTWAGFLPLSLRSNVTSQYAVFDSVLRLVAIDKLVGQPFPLVPGSGFSLSATFENIDNAGKASYHGQAWSCRVGASAPATTTIPGMAGEQTEVTCRMSHAARELPPQDSVMTWYSAAGCFIQDPTR
ncbi:MAG TPA: hypothetical protein VIK70_07865 [Lysobacter sp.]